MNKLLLINKPQNMTSFDVVAIVRKKLNIKKDTKININELSSEDKELYNK